MTTAEVNLLYRYYRGDELTADEEDRAERLIGSQRVRQARPERVAGTAGVGGLRGTEQDQLGRRQRRGEALIFRNGQPTSERW